MMIFWKKNKNEDTLNSKEYESLCKKLIELSSELEDLKIKLKILTTDQNNLRGNFNRKLGGLKKEEKTEEATETETNLKPNVFLSPNGTPI